LLLRASGRTHNKTYQLATVTSAIEGDGGVPSGDLLIAFAEAVLGADDSALPRARGALAGALGSLALVDAAGVVGLFNAIDRIADATGIPLEPEKAAASADFRAALDLDRFAVAERT
jgi:hypothetical protein